jgi:HK97 family phage major capsid protein
MTAAELDRLHELYRQAGEQARDETLSEETRNQALDDVVSLRHKLDDALIEAQREREIDQARAAMEIQRGNGDAGQNALEAKIRAWAEPPVEGGPKSRVLEIPFVKSRANEEWFKDTSQTTKAGYLYTDELVTSVIWHENAQSGVLRAGPTYFDTPEGRTVKFPTLVTDASAAQTAERTAATITEPVFGQGQLDSYRLDGFMVLTQELIRDSEINVWPLVTEVANRALATKVAATVATDDGSGKPHGLSHAAASGVTAASQTDFTAEELINLYLSVLPGARARGSWILGSTAYGKVFKMKDGEGRYLFNPSVAAGVPDTILGKPMYEDAGYPACTLGLKPVTFGDVSSFYVRRIGGVRIERDDSVYFTQFESTVRFSMYVDSDLFDTAQVKAITLAS